MRTLITFILFVCAGAGADTFTNIETGKKLEGKLLGTIIERGKRIYLVKVGRDHRKLEEDLWSVKLTPPPGEDYKWQPTIYQNEVRDAAWLKSTYRSVSRHFTIIRGVPVDLRLPVVENLVVKHRKVRIEGLVRNTIKDKEILLLVQLKEQWRGKGAVEMRVAGLDATGIESNSQWSGVVAFTQIPGSHRRGTLVCTPIPKEPGPLTPEQFVALLAKNFDFALQKPKPKPKPKPEPSGWVTCSKCWGKKTVRVMAKRISGGIYEYYMKTTECPKCRGRGRVYQTGG